MIHLLDSNTIKSRLKMKRAILIIMLMMPFLFVFCTENKKQENTCPWQMNFMEPSSTYIISKTYDLKGTTLNIPNDCHLVYRGGSFKNGVICFDNTRLEGKVKNSNIKIDGVLSNDTVYTSWFFPSGIVNQDAFNQLVSAVNDAVIMFDADYTLHSDRKFTGNATHNKYHFDGINIKSNITYVGNGHTIYCGNADDVFNTIYDYLHSNDHTPRTNWRITGFTLARSEKDTVQKQTEATSIYIRNGLNGKVDHCRFLRWKGQAVHISLLPINGKEYQTRNIVVRDCEFHGTLSKGEKFNSGNGLNVISGENIHVVNCSFYDIKTDPAKAGQWPGAIDIETEEYHANVNNVYIDSCTIVNCGWLAPVSFAGFLDDDGNPKQGFGGGNGTAYVSNLIAKGCEYAVSVQNGRACAHVIFDNVDISDAKKLFIISNNSNVRIDIYNSRLSSVNPQQTRSALANFSKQVHIYNSVIK